MKIDLSKIDIMILCGGLGKRLRPVIGDKPKILSKVINKPFIDILFDNLKKQGFTKVILCVGHKGEAVREYCDNKVRGIDIVVSFEEKPLGTGGALKNAKDLIKSDVFFVMNGDVLCDLDFYNFYKSKKAILSVVVSRVNNCNDFGSVRLGKNMRILEFREKEKKNNEGFCSAGIYIMNKDIFNFMPKQAAFSLEYDFFPNIIKKPCYGYIIKDDFLDIGTPENFIQAEKWVK